MKEFLHGLGMMLIVLIAMPTMVFLGLGLINFIFAALIH